MEEDNLISKKELLKITNISYGQLYRWKRKDLIPEDWFIKKSSFTGQETFFPRKEILDRIEKIKNLKEDVSLDELAKIFSPNLSSVFLEENEILKQNIVSQAAINLYKDVHKESNGFYFNELLFISIVDKFIKSGKASLEEGRLVLDTLEKNYKNFDGRCCDVVLMRKFGVGICFLMLIPNEIYIESEAILVLKVNAAECVEKLKSKINYNEGKF
ncbi:YhbD family protein [Clostridium sp. BJN0001]|uniref:YhbD family protein n=1 Tax=Clostridium sp. BJN0001 TaxID=2930219 RepID=UPI001FD4192B|nr:YhbD family protein [Clostridium sp. BJN0001]